MKVYKRYNFIKLGLHIGFLILYIHFKTGEHEFADYFNNALIMYQVGLVWVILNGMACISFTRKMFRTPFNSEKKKYMKVVGPRLLIAFQEMKYYSEAVMVRHCLLGGLIVLGALRFGDYILSLQWFIHEVLVYSIYSYARRVYA